MHSIGLTDLKRRSWRAINWDGLRGILFGYMFLGASASALVRAYQTPDWLRIMLLSIIQSDGVLWIVWASRRSVTSRLGHDVFEGRESCGSCAS